MPVSITISLAPDLIGLLRTLGKPLEEAVPELVVLELYRECRVSSGKAAELLGMTREAFIQYTSALAIPFLNMSDEELQVDLAGCGKTLARPTP
jgi:predicted HTH domain antitoxin